MQTSQSLRDLFEAALELAPGARAAFLDEHCADAALRAQVERLLLADADAAALFSGGARAAAAAIGDATLADALPPGSHVGPFELVAVLGEGGSSTVFHARREVQGVEQSVALKILRRGLYSPDAQRQFRRERQALAQLQHPGIARLIEGGVTDNGLAYIALELVEGESITDHARGHRLDLRARLVLFLQVCRAVEAAHRALIVHRDLKPSNVLVAAESQVKLLDFGIAKLLDRDDETQTRLPAFTPAYAAPEQRDGGMITTATDVYALGVLLGELVTGQRLTGGSGRTPSSQLTKDTAPGVLPAPVPVTRRALRGDLDNIVLKAIEFEPERRYASAGALADDIERMLEGRPVAAHPPSRVYRARKFVSRHRAAVAATFALTVALVGALAVALWQANVAGDAARRALREAARANATRDFLLRVFRASDPRVAQDKPRGEVTAKELLDLNAPRIAEQFAQDPETRIDLLGVAASIYRELDDDARYEALHRQQLDLARSIHGELHPAVITGLLDDADHANQRSDYSSSLALLAQADSLLKRAGLDRSVLRARWYMLRASAELPDDDPGPDSDQALHEAETLYAALAPNDPGRVNTLTTLGFRKLAADPALAEPYFQRAIEVAQYGGSDRNDSLLQQFAYPGLGQARESRGDYAGSLEAYAKSIELARKTYGLTNSKTWVAFADYAAKVHRNGERERALQMFAQLLAVMPADWDRDSYAAFAREFYADRLAAEGRAAEAIPILEQSQRFYIAHPSVPYEMRRNRLTLGDAYDRVGRTAEAREQLKASLDERIAKDPPEHRTVLIARERWGRFLFEHGDSAGAAEQFQKIFEQAHDRPLEAVALAQGDAARLALARGDIAAAVDSSREAAATFDHVTAVRDVRSGPYLWLIRSEALQRSGDTSGAREWAQRALDASRRYDDPSAASIRAAQASLKAATKT